MSWIKENKFAAVLGGSTLVGAGLLYFLGSMGADKYEAAKTRFDEAATAAGTYEKLPVYPKAPNRDGKRAAIDDYRKALEGLQKTFAPYRAGEIKNITPQEFTEHLLAANKETRDAFEAAGTIVPEPYFVGFNRYKTVLAPATTTGILDYQLGALKNILMDLAKSRPTELKNVFRPPLPEEEGQPYNAGNNVARAFPLELTFVANEKSVREFISALNKVDKQFVVIRSMRITNLRKDPPRATDVKFDAPVTAKSAGFAVPDFVIPGETPAPLEAPKPEESKKTAGSSRILAQVLGTEELAVFIRLDVLQFLPVKLPN